MFPTETQVIIAMENTFASALREVRKRRRLRQEDLARMLGVGRPTIANWERGAKLPSLASLIKLSQMLHVSTDELLGTAGAQQPSSVPKVFPTPVDPVVALAAERSGVSPAVLAAFIAALKSQEHWEDRSEAGT